MKKVSHFHKRSIIVVWERFPMLVRSGANVTSENPERDDALRLEDGEQSDVREPERNGILRLDEMMSRRPRAIDTYRSLSYFNELIRLFVFVIFYLICNPMCLCRERKGN